MSLKLLDHPNHYILVVDSSGSIQGRLSTLGLDQVLAAVEEGLYDTGFGPAVPPYDPERDLLSLYHFGIVDSGDANTAINRLRQYDLWGLLQRRMFRRSAVSREDLALALHPPLPYRLTFLHLARNLALHQSRPESPDAESHRTFLVKIDDRKPNSGSMERETFDLEYGKPRNLRQVRDTVDAISEAYEFRVVNSRMFPEEGDARVFLTVYEVISKTPARWKDQLTRGAPFVEPAVLWTKENHDGATGELRGTLGEGLARLAVPVTVEVRGPGVQGTTTWNPGKATAVTVPVKRQGRLTCSPTPVEVTLRAAPQQADDLLGVSVYDYRATLPLNAAPPSRCGLPFRIRTAGLWILCGGIVLLGLVSMGVRSFRTPLWAKLPGMSQLVGLNWDEPVEQRGSLTVNPGSQFVRLELPPYLIQFLAYPWAVLRIEGPAAEGLRWSHNQSALPLRLPIRTKTLTLMWKHEPPENHDWVEISFATGQRVARLLLGRAPNRTRNAR